jgi:DNA-directed RNA polymerase specialized sigma24 family protein
MRAVYSELLRTARRWTRRAEEAQDLVHDAFVEALERGRVDWRAPEGEAWLRGVVRRRAAFQARTAGRRRRREALVAGAGSPSATSAQNRWRWSEQVLAALPRSLRVLAALVAADLSAVEIRWALRLTDTAFRKRVSELRKAVQGVLQDPEAVVAVPMGPGHALGPLRAELIQALKRHGSAALGTHDPDGHALIFCFPRGGPLEKATRGNG